MISSNNKNDNENKIKSHIKPLPDGSYEIYKNEMKSFYYVLAAFLFALMSIYFLKSGYRVVGYILLTGFAGAALIALKMVLFKLVYKFMQHNIKLYGTPYIIQTDTLSAHRREILDLFNKFQEEYLEKGVL